MGSNRKTYYTISVTSGMGNRITKGRYTTKSDAKKAINKLKKSWRTDADTYNPRIKKYKGYL